jgi:hypothetical protein
MLDQREFPFAFPGFQLLLSRYGFNEVAILLVPNQLFDAVFRREGRSDARTVLCARNARLLVTPM